jgi:UDP-N-acetylmuramoyl-tripeptide--D-alanyl-D-alanine ligase
VVTSFPDTPVHVEFFSSREALWEEDAEIIRALPKDGVVVTNADDRNIGQYLTRVSNPILTYGMHEACDVRGTSVRAYSDHGVVRGMEMDVVYRSERKTIRIPGILGDHLMYALLAGISVGIAEGVTYEDCISGVSESERPKGRMRIYEGLNHTTLIDDTELTDEDELEELELSVAMAVASMLMESAPAATVAANFFIEKGAGNNGT